MDERQLLQVLHDSLYLEKVNDEKRREAFIAKYLEPLDVIDEEGHTIGSAPRGLVHRVGLRHRTVFVMVLAPDGRVLLQTRGHSAASSPLKLDVGVSGHVASGETDLVASAAREMSEELGLAPDPSRLSILAEYNRDCPVSLDRPQERNRERRTLLEYHLSSVEVDSLTNLFSKRMSKPEVAGHGWFGVGAVLAALDEGRAADGLVSSFSHWLASRAR